MKTTSERKHADWFPSSNMPKCLLNVQSGACASEQKHPGGRSRLAAMFNSVAEFAFRGCAAASPLPLSIRPPCQKESTNSLGRGRGRSLSLHLWVAATHLELLADYSLVEFQLAPASIIFAISKAFHCWRGDTRCG